MTPPRFRPRAPLLVLGLSAALLAVGVARERSERPARTDRDPPPPPASGTAGKAADPPVRGWWSVLKRVHRRISEDRVTAIAGGVTFFALLAMFPAAAALVSIYGLFADPHTLTDQFDAMATVLPGGALEVIGDQLRRLAEQGRSSLGTAFLISLAAAVWSANAGMKALFDALNIVYGETETRGFFVLNLMSLGFTLGGLLFILTALAAVVVLPVVFSVVGLDSAVSTMLRVGRWPLLVAGLAVSLAVIYRWGPSRTQARLRWISWGSAAASVAWLVASLGFSWYAANFGSFNKTYGTLGAAVGLMTWMWISSIVVLAGAELDAELERQDPAVPERHREGGLGRPS